jgi:hypothetical protein
MKLLCAWLLVLSGCTDRPTFDQLCGNFVIDPGEDCDEGTSGGTCDSQCRIVCDVDTRSCGGVAGYVCGVDGFCHAPSGVLSVHRPGEVPFPGKVFTVTDVDRDYIGDVVTVSDTSLTVNYGDTTGELLIQTSTLIPGARGEPAFTDLDSDGSMDVVIPTTDGLVAYSSPLDVVAPHPFVLDIGNPADCTPAFAGQPFNVFALDKETLGLLIARPDGKLGVATIRVDSQSTCPNLQQKVCDVRVGDFFLANAHVTLAHYDTSTTGALGQTGKLVAATSNLSNGGTCVVNFTRPRNAPASTSYTVTEALATATKARPALADFAGGGCPSLIDSSGSFGLKEHKGSGTLLCALIGVAHADRKVALKFFRAGEKAYQAQNFEAAAHNFYAAYEQLPLPEIAFSAAQAFRRQYRVDPKQEYVQRSVELYRFYLSKVKTGVRVADAADSLGEMERELDSSSGAARWCGSHQSSSRRGAGSP